jgi:phage gp36-like protein
MSVTLPAGCTRDRLDKRKSQLGVDLQIDDDPDSLTSMMEDAWVEVQGYCSVRYSDTQLGTSEWVLLRWTDICLMFLAERRDNPAPQACVRRYEKAVADLERVELGEKAVPDAATRKAAAPTLTNQRVKLYPHPNVVSKPSTSTGTPSGYDRSTDPHDYDPNPGG